MVDVKLNVVPSQASDHTLQRGILPERRFLEVAQHVVLALRNPGELHQRTADVEVHFAALQAGKALAELKAKGMDVVDRVDAAAWQKAMKPIFDKYAQQFGDRFRKIVDTR